MKSTKLRRAVFAGSWYPSSAAECEKEIEGYLAEGKKMDFPAGELVGGSFRMPAGFFRAVSPAM